VTTTWFSAPISRFVNTIRRHHAPITASPIMMERNMNLNLFGPDWVHWAPATSTAGCSRHLVNGYSTRYVKKEFLQDKGEKKPQKLDASVEPPKRGTGGASGRHRRPHFLARRAGMISASAVSDAPARADGTVESSHPHLNFIPSGLCPAPRRVLACAQLIHRPSLAFTRIMFSMPPVTQALIFVNVLVYLLQTAAGDHLVLAFGLWPLSTGVEGQFDAAPHFQLLAARDLWFSTRQRTHLFFNMLALFMLVRRSSECGGAAGTTVYYFACVVSGRAGRN